MHGGILGPDEASFADVAELGIAPIDLVAVNLYRFGEARAQGGTEAQLVSKIDVGGPTMLRAAAKNFQRVTVVPDPAHYAEVLAELEVNDGSTSLELRRRLAAAVFRLTERYDDAIADWLEGVTGRVDHGVGLRYGENPHQGARMFLPGGGDLASVGLVLHGGKELSYNNLVDLIAGLKLAGDFREPCCAILKHTNPCGFAVGDAGAGAGARACAAIRCRLSAASSPSTPRSTKRRRRCSPSASSRSSPRLRSRRRHWPS